MNFSQEREYIGDLSQLFGVKQYTLTDGKSAGVRAVDIDNGGGLFFTVLADRCMDLHQIRYAGVNLNYLAPVGVVNPLAYDASGFNWLRSFDAGFLTTVGLSNIGLPNGDSGDQLGLHGRIANTPSERFSVQLSDDGEPCVTITGVMREAELFTSNLKLTRTYKCRLRSNEIEMTDVVENAGYRVSPFMILYHFNFGYPLLDENARVIIDAENTTPRNSHAADYLAQWKTVLPPQDNFEEMCYYHNVKTDAQNHANIGIYNPNLRLKALIEYDNGVLDHLLQWKMFGKGEYVMGIEPCNGTGEGRADARANGSLKFLAPGEKITFHFRLKFFSGDAAGAE
ncbi:MAG: aldose 1-epimerase family protein [Clostridia bacterium]|nr:aldose 1-epimerase family protein [Clostridia bacterium]